MLQWQEQLHPSLHCPNVSPKIDLQEWPVCSILTYANFSLPSPYYIWLGCSRNRDTTDAIQAFEVEAGNRVIVPPSFPELSFAHLLSASKTQILTEKSGQDSAVVSAHGGVLTDASNLVKRRGSEANSTSSSTSGFKIDLGPHVPLSSFHYQKRQWRLPYSE